METVTVEIPTSWLLSDKLRELMADKNLSNRQLAEESNVHETTISRIRTGVNRNVREDTLMKLAKALKISSWSELLGPVPK